MSLLSSPGGPGHAPLPAAALVPLLLVILAFVIFCVVDVARAQRVRYLPRWLWVVICLISMPWGGIAYLVFGKER
jgi:Phospholipase_D-nuclease N-terminal